jgi:hypothetical protein
VQDAATLALYFAVQLVGLALIPFALPGLWIQVGAAAVLVATTGRLGWGWVGAFVALALVGEVIEFLSGHWGARRFGGSRAAAWGALAGGLAGALVGGIPVPIVGSIVMSFVGTFAGAVAGEMLAMRRLDARFRIGLGAVVGRAIGVAVKLGVGIVVLVLSAAGMLGGGAP